MENHYKTLLTIYNITKEDTQPETYKCRPREIILRQYQNWNIIEQHLHLLQQEGLVNLKQEDTIIIFITKAGIKKITSEQTLQWKMRS